MATVEDRYADAAKASGSLGDRFEEITPHDTNPLTRSYKYIVAGATLGVVRCEDIDGNVEDFYVAAGGRLPCRPHIIHSTATVATPIIGVFDG